jgi:hypothetical protein
LLTCLQGTCESVILSGGFGHCSTILFGLLDTPCHQK